MNELIAKSINSLKYNRPQRNFWLNIPFAKIMKCIWGRGVGKSTIMALLFHIINMSMMRSCWVLQGASFQQILTRTLPGTIDFLVKMGYRKDIDFFLNTYPPKGYELPFNCPLKPEHCLFLVNHKNKTSVAFTFFSQDRSSSRGPSRDGIIADESLLLDIDKFNEEAKATNRGNEMYFGKNPMHHAVYHFSSMPKGKHWLTDTADYYNDIQMSKLFHLRSQEVELELEFVRNKNPKDRVEIYKEIYNIMKQLNFVAHDKQYYSEYSAFENLHNLTPRYFDDLYSDNTELLFRIEVLNERVMKIEESFYPGLNRDVHGYKGHFDYSYLDNLDITDQDLDNHLNSQQDLDCDPNRELIIGMDFGTAINWIIVGQETRTAAGHEQFNFINNLFVKSPKTIDDVVRKFCTYYRFHKKKIIRLYPDGEGNQRRANVPGQLSYVDQVERIMRKEGWTVVREKLDKYNPSHHLTYILWDRCLDSKNLDYPNITFNLINCKDLIYSMEQTPAKDDGSSKIKKDKSSEKKLKTNRQEATDAGDGADQIIRNRYGKYLKGRGQNISLLFNK